jgi:hypothetical protein
MAGLKHDRRPDDERAMVRALAAINADGLVRRLSA